MTAQSGKISRRKVLVGLGLLASTVSGVVLLDEIDFDTLLLQNGKDNSPDSAQGAESKRVPLYYSKGYNISAFGIEHLHPFDGCKYHKIYQALNDIGLRSKSDYRPPEPITREELLEIHSSKYLNSLSDGIVLSRILEMSILAKIPAQLTDWRILRPMRLACGGTLAACNAAIEHGLAINIGGGYHHAESDRGGGFCVYCDGPIAIKRLKQSGKIKTALIVDTDAHQGNGFANVARTIPGLYVLDFFDQSIYPKPKVKEDWSVPLPAKTDGSVHLAKLKSYLPEAIAKFKPDFIFYNAGSDVLATDPLATLLLRVEDMCERDLFVVSMARSNNIPIAMVLAGGYGSESALAHTKSIEAILRKFDQ
ncbi:MAG: histone deacetylase [Candidatus Obscuribacter sp.]|nr:histone deacetylase [Candidatus Obscuribacter sp.]